ncbi:hypothetical protein GCM10027429_08440 [Marivirga atlantica]
MLVLAQVLKADVPDYKNMPNTVEAKAGFLNQKLKDLILPNFKIHKNSLYPAFIEWGFSGSKLMDEVTMQEHDLIQEIVGPEQHNEESLNEIGYAIEQLVRKKERYLYEAVQEECKEQLDQFELEEV